MARRQTKQPAPPLPGAFTETFDSFYTREWESIVGLALVLSRSRTAAEDLAQEAFVQALIRWDSIQQVWYAVIHPTEEEIRIWYDAAWECARRNGIPIPDPPTDADLPRVVNSTTGCEPWLAVPAR